VDNETNRLLVDIENLELRIQEKLLLSDFSLQQLGGKRVGISGPSGCGKTTLLRSIINGFPPKRSTLKKFKIYSKYIAYVPQEAGLIPWFSLKKNLDFFLRKSFSKENSKNNTVQRIANEYGLESCINNFPNMLSGGEYQRAVLACATITKPKLFIVDEPLTEVDTLMKWTTLESFSTEIEQTSSSLLIVSHDVDILSYLCDEVIILGSKPVKIVLRHKLPGKHPKKRDDLTIGSLYEAREKLFEFLIKNKSQ
jgi:NitT/TauT family transport system ATP-binding protein